MATDQIPALAPSERGVGGKLRKSLLRKPLPSRCWISKLVGPAYRLIVGGATRILPSFFYAAAAAAASAAPPPSLLPCPTSAAEDQDEEECKKRHGNSIYIRQSCFAALFALTPFAFRNRSTQAWLQT